MTALTELFAVDPGFALLAVLAAYFSFALAATLGIGGAALLTPILLLGLDAPTAVAVIAPAMLLRTGYTLWVYRRDLERRAALLATVAAVPASVAAALFTAWVEPRLLRGGIALLILSVLAVQHGAGRSIRVERRGLVGWGAASGLAGGLTGIAGPPLAIALKGYGLTRAPFVATVSAIMLAVQAARLPTYLATGVLSSEMIPLSLLLASASVPAVATGRLFLARLDADRFRRALDILLGALAVLLILGALRG